MRRAVVGANCRCYVAPVPGRPAPAAQVEGLSAVLVGWRRMTRSAAEPTSSPPSSVKNSESLEEEAEKSGVVVDLRKIIGLWNSKSKLINSKFEQRKMGIKSGRGHAEEIIVDRLIVVDR
ncbi:hypothetical protein SASPL_143647 [Salvia splendens]|uniref:Uncharacterized protein n=1 Tax=Salvia splendens TaxID=180675 RepID=A0A8X8WMF7_SALSN|nr:hypothetical protein SASPL_143647 [Salvia splendens]